MYKLTPMCQYFITVIIICTFYPNTFEKFWLIMNKSYSPAHKLLVQLLAMLFPGRSDENTGHQSTISDHCIVTKSVFNIFMVFKIALWNRALMLLETCDKGTFYMKVSIWHSV